MRQYRIHTWDGGLPESNLKMHVPVKQTPFYACPAPPSPKFHWEYPPTLSPLQHEVTRLHAHTHNTVSHVYDGKSRRLLIIKWHAGLWRDRTHRWSPVVGGLPAVCPSGCWVELLEMTADWRSWGSRRTKHWLIHLFQRSTRVCVHGNTSAKTGIQTRSVNIVCTTLTCLGDI